jgi:aryl-alcohol dehydrogenase-like predicted oxidoreductase
MIYKNISGTDLQVSAICLGNGFMIHDKTDEERFAFLDAYTAMGGNIIDSALIYGYDEQLGISRSEQMLGKWIKSRGNRNQIILSTKGAHPFPATDSKMRLSEAEIRSDLDKSLRTLGADTIDLYWLHRDDPSRPVEEIAGTLKKLVDEGKIRYSGCSNWAPERIEAAGCFVANQLSWSCARNDAQRLAEKRLRCMDDLTFKMHNQLNLTAFAYSSQAQGLMSLLGTLDIKSIKNKFSNYDNPENEQRYIKIIELSKKKNATTSQIALAWLMAKPFTVIPIIGCSSYGHLEEAMNSVNIDLSYAEANEIGIC